MTGISHTSAVRSAGALPWRAWSMSTATQPQSLLHTCPVSFSVRSVRRGSFFGRFAINLS
jgi:hypothetical protein